MNPLLRLLLADDDLATARLLSMALSRQGFEVVHVADGTDAVVAAAGDSFDLMVLDLQMPTMDGVAALQVIRVAEAANGRRTPAIVLTGSIERAEARLTDAGFDRCLTKPVRSDALVATIRELLGR